MFRLQFDASAAQLHSNVQTNLNNQARSRAASPTRLAGALTLRAARVSR